MKNSLSVLLIPLVTIIIPAYTVLLILVPALLPGDVPVKFTVQNNGKKKTGCFTVLKSNSYLDTADLAASYLNYTVEVSSIHTGHSYSDEMLQGNTWFDAMHYPQIIFRSVKIEKNTSGYLVTGQMTIKAKTALVAIPFIIENSAAGDHILKGNFTVKPDTYGVGNTSGNNPDIAITLLLPASTAMVTRQG
jgi:polyisoprenoid-binding protein YceI